MKVPISDDALVDLDAPCLPAWEYISAVTDAVSWMVWCRYCEDWHRHGPMEGHREAHCTDSTSPYIASGYNLSLRGDWPDAFKE